MSRATLVVIGGLPGTGKTTLARLPCRRLAAAHLRIDSIEQALRSAGINQVGAAGYAIGAALAHANLTLGLSIVADCANSIAISRAGWATTAESAAARLAQVQLICSDPAEHRRRLEERVADLDGHILPTWAAVLERRFEPWDGDVLLLDTAGTSTSALCEQVIRYLDE